MKTLVYGMQSSGASYITWRLSQDPNTISVLDLFAHASAPAFNLEHKSHDVIVKCAAVTLYGLDDQIECFAPDRLILVTRKMKDVVQSLSTKPYRNYGGLVSQKCEVFKREVSKHKADFDEVIAYEDICKIPFVPTRSVGEIVEFNIAHSKWCAANFNIAWGTGNIHA